MSQPTIADNLWNAQVTPDSYGSSEQYYAHVFEQYKLFVDSADQISNRRNQANTFFLTLHTFLIVAAQFLYEKGPTTMSDLLLILPLVAVLMLCAVWWLLLKSYRQLNRAKFKVIGEYEKILPSSPYVRAEWIALGSGRDPKLYTPLTTMEQIIPIVFAALYIAGALVIFLA